MNAAQKVARCRKKPTEKPDAEEGGRGKGRRVGGEEEEEEVRGESKVSEVNLDSGTCF